MKRGGIFTHVQNERPKSSTFDLSYQRKMSLDMGQLIPIHVQEVVPGDRFQHQTSIMIRMAPMVAPVMHQITAYTHYFFVPNRLVWPQWELFNENDGVDPPEFPKIFESNVVAGSLKDYLGLPIWSGTERGISAVPFAAYQMIYNEYYRDQNLIDPVAYELSNGDNALIRNDLVQLRRRAWQHDYFTSALPWTQKGAQATIPLGTTAPIDFDTDGGLATFVRNASGQLETNRVFGTVRTQAGGLFQLEENGTTESFNIDNSDLLSVDLQQATAASIIDLRNAFALQEFLEKNARGGSRYIELIKSHFGVNSSDARLNRPEFLGGGSTPIRISEVLQTSAAASEPTPQGNMAGHGIGAGANNGFTYRAEEHGYIIGIMSVMPKTAYQQGIPKHFDRFDKFDYFWPEFQHIGEQPIKNRELYVTGDDQGQETFGYTPRYSAYKYNPDTVHGEFKTSLDFWHMGRIFSSRPSLNEDFINCDPTKRIFAVESAPETLYAQVYHSIKANRKMAYYGNPKM